MTIQQVKDLVYSYKGIWISDDFADTIREDIESMPNLSPAHIILGHFMP